jgi:hypothetical protein
MQRIYDTREGKKVELGLREPGKVGMYVCGVTVYDLCHVGHARTLVSFDVIVRHLRQRGLAVRLVRNITDVDDKIIRKGHAEGRTAAEVAKFYADAMAADMAALGIAPPDIEPRATEHIAEMIDVIRSGWKIAVWPTRRKATCTIRSLDFRATAGCLAKASTILQPAHASRWASTNEVPSTSRCGRAPSRASPRGRARGDPDAQAGTSSARPWLTATSAMPSIFTAAVRI